MSQSPSSEPSSSVHPAPQPGGGFSPPPGPDGPPPGVGLAVAALVLGIIGLCVPLVGVAALVLGVIAINRADAAREGGGRGMATAGAILGGIGTVLAVVVMLVALLIGIMLPALGASRNAARRMQNNTQIRGIHQGMVIYAQGNQGRYPGLGPKADSPDDLRIERRFEMLLDGDYFTPEYMFSPNESDGSKQVWATGAVTADHYSYAMLQVPHEQGPPHSGRWQEWSETMNMQAVAITDRNTGQGPASTSPNPSRPRRSPTATPGRARPTTRWPASTPTIPATGAAAWRATTTASRTRRTTACARATTAHRRTTMTTSSTLPAGATRC